MNPPHPIPQTQCVEVRIAGMDCANCVTSVRTAISEVPGVVHVEVWLASEKARVNYETGRTEPAHIRRAVEKAGYRIRTSDRFGGTPAKGSTEGEYFSRRAMTLMGIIFGAVLFVVVIGEWLGLFEVVTDRMPWWLGAALVLAFGYPVFRTVARAALGGRVISHGLMSFGALTALAVGEWATAAVVVFFMRVGDYAESVTTEKARRSLEDLISLAPPTARIERDDVEQEVPVAEVRLGDVVVVRPGETIPVDGQVTSGEATVDQGNITGESMPVEVSAGDHVYAATLAQLGSLRVRASAVGRDTSFGKVVSQVEEADANRGEVQRLADRFSAWYLPIVAGIALLTYLLSGDLMATVAVTVVACSCAFALATPVAMLASIGASARRGVLIKGGKYIELLANADVLLVDKTGTMTLGRPELTDIVALGDLDETGLLALASTAEYDSEHPLAQAVRQAARARRLPVAAPERFESLPGKGVRATINGRQVAVGSYRLLEGGPQPDQAQALEARGKTVLYVLVDGDVIGLLAAADTLRSDVPAALGAVRELGIEQIELLTGDNARSAAAIAEPLGIDYQANLLPEDKIAVVKRLQEQGHRVVMIGDGVNDAPALVQADVGIAMAVAGTDVAIEAAHVALLSEDWSLVPELLRTARRTMGVVKVNIGFTALYNLVGISLAAVGLLPPIFAAALQSIPDLGIMGNSARLLRPKFTRTTA